jgi:AraC-like DNA-binding protein
MLVATNFTLAEIAYECGFSSQSYFSYAFKRKMNKTPRKYAEEIFDQYE